MLVDIEPLALSPSQIIERPEDDDVGGFSFDSILADTAAEEEDEEPASAARLVDPEDIGFAADPKLTADLTAQLIEPATQAAVRSSIPKLNGLGLGNSGATIESLMRDMLRPMLKEWLDENLPSVVERMVEKEIARVARGD